MGGAPAGAREAADGGGVHAVAGEVEHHDREHVQEGLLLHEHRLVHIQEEDGKHRAGDARQEQRAEHVVDRPPAQYSPHAQLRSAKMEEDEEVHLIYNQAY